MAILTKSVEPVSALAGSVEKCRAQDLPQPEGAEPRREREGDADDQDEGGADNIHTCMVPGGRPPWSSRRGLWTRQNTTTGLIVTPASESANALLMSSKA